MLKKQTSGGNNEGNFLLWFHWSHLRLMFALLAVMQCSVSFWLEASAFSILLFLLSLHSAAWQQQALCIPAAYTPSRHWGLHQRFPHPPPQLHSFPLFFNSTDAKTQSLLNGLALLSLTLFCTAADAVYPSKATLKTGHMHCVFIINVLQKYNIPSVSLSLQFETSIIIHYKKSINKQKENRTCQ